MAGTRDSRSDDGGGARRSIVPMSDDGAKAGDATAIISRVSTAATLRTSITSLAFNGYAGRKKRPVACKRPAGALADRTQLRHEPHRLFHDHDRREDGGCHEARQDSPAEVEMTYIAHKSSPRAGNAQVSVTRDDRICRVFVAIPQRFGLNCMQCTPPRDRSTAPRGFARREIGAAGTRASRHGRGGGAHAAMASALGERPRPEIEIARSSTWMIHPAPWKSSAQRVDPLGGQKLADAIIATPGRSGIFWKE